MPMIADERALWIDVSVPIRPGMVTFDGDPAVHLERTTSLAGGNVCNISRLDFGVHSGTHVDAPVHFIDGAAGTERVLFRSENSALWAELAFEPTFTGLTEDGAAALIERGSGSSAMTIWSSRRSAGRRRPTGSCSRPMSLSSRGST